MAESGRIHAGGGHGIGSGLDDFDHGAVGGLDEDGLAARRPVIDDETEMLHIPFG